MKRKAIVLMIAIMIAVGIFQVKVYAADNPPFTLESPNNLTAVQKYDVNNIPYFEIKLDIPQSVKDIDRNINENSGYYPGTDCQYVIVNFEYKYGNYDWNKGPSMYWDTSVDLQGYTKDGFYEYRPFDKGGFDSIDISAEVYQFRAYFSSLWGETGGWVDKTIKSGYSNTATVGNSAYSDRLSGASRTETAVAVSKKGWPNGADAVILTREDNYPDALTGAPLSKKLDAPILFTDTKILTPATETEIARLKAKKVIILGGYGAVSESIESILKQSYEVKRIGGADRYETAAKIAKELGYTGKVVITTGEDFHDALVVSPLAAYKGIPILLTLPDELPSSSKDALGFITPAEITIVGNNSSVSESVASGLTNAKRISGSDIYESAVNVVKHFGADPSNILLATGKDFPDALSGSGLAAKYNSPILFVDDPLSGYVKQYLNDSKSKSPKINLLGGEGAISKNVKDTVDGIFK